LAAEIKQKRFASAEEGVQALITALKANDVNAMLAILGPEARPLILSGDSAADREDRERVVREYEASNNLAKPDETKAILQVGNAPLLHYAQKFLSSKGQRDGLYWATMDGEEPSPLGPLIARAQGKGYVKAKDARDKPVPYYGYYYRILKAQGPDAPGGAYDYVVRGKMLGGFALVAYPASWGNSGVMTFLVNHDGVVYQKDLSPNTAALARKSTRFNPDSTWTHL
jgi:hypothetical protein